MATIRASCDSCGDVEFTPSRVKVHAPEDGGAGTYTFECPECHGTMVRYAERPTMDLLIAAGVPYTTWRRPAELIEREQTRGVPLTHSDLMAFHELVEDDAALHAALASIAETRGGGDQPGLGR